MFYVFLQELKKIKRAQQILMQEGIINSEPACPAVRQHVTLKNKI